MSLPVTRIETPTPWSGVGPVNAYLVEGSPLTLVDSGFNSPQGQNALRLSLASRELFLESIERILVTHGHPDHYGMVALIQESSGATVYFPEREIARVRDRQMLFEVGKLLLEAGMPPLAITVTSGTCRTSWIESGVGRPQPAKISPISTSLARAASMMITASWPKRWPRIRSRPAPTSSRTCGRRGGPASPPKDAVIA